jgi:hypothetical protein
MGFRFFCERWIEPLRKMKKRVNRTNDKAKSAQA